MRILIADDDFIGRTKIKQLLSEYGECTTVSTGELAIQAFDRAHNDPASFDLITMDIMMPGLSGQEAVQRIRQWEKMYLEKPEEEGVKIMMITGRKDSTSTLSSFKAGCETYLVKPVTADRLQVALQELGFDVGQPDA